MIEAAAAGVPPHLFWDYTFRELHGLLTGAQLIARRSHKLALFGAYQAEGLARTKRLPPLEKLLSKLDPLRDMSAKDIRAAVLGMAQALGAKVVRRSKTKG